MQLEGIHHISAITGDAPANVDFYARVLGMRLVKKTVNQDDPTVYHLFYADEDGSPGADLTFFEYPGARQGRHGSGMVHTIVFRVASEAALDFWVDRLAGEGIEASRDTGRIVFADPEGLGLEFVVVERPDAPLSARSLDVPAEFALQGFEAVRAYADDWPRSEALLSGPMGLTEIASHDWEARGELRGGRIVFEDSPGRGVPGAGTVHHVAWSIGLGEEEAWQQLIARTGLRPTPVIDRFYFRSVYFREPSGILYELATRGPGFTSDEPKETLGEALSLPPNFEAVRDSVSQKLTPLPDVTQWRPAVTA
ncbi:MAG: VOC family protein [Solirubrobacteraceae bacterium]|nr:VOC family protein [Patulibacter sp.]